VTLNGWVRSARAQKAIGFMELTDGSCPTGMQIVWETGGQAPAIAAELARQLTTGAAVRVSGSLVRSPKPQQPVEVAATRIEVLGPANAQHYPIQKKVSRRAQLPGAA
jgi:asparaginyl-tRNA synthetase